MDTIILINVVVILVGVVGYVIWNLMKKVEKLEAMIDVQEKYEKSKSKVAQNLKVIINLKQMIGIRVNSEGKLAGVKTHLISC